MKQEIPVLLSIIEDKGYITRDDDIRLDSHAYKNILEKLTSLATKTNSNVDLFGATFSNGNTGYGFDGNTDYSYIIFDQNMYDTKYFAKNYSKILEIPND